MRFIGWEMLCMIQNLLHEYIEIFYFQFNKNNLVFILIRALNRLSLYIDVLLAKEVILKVFLVTLKSVLCVIFLTDYGLVLGFAPLPLFHCCLLS